jgi:hypothetical protein
MRRKGGVARSQPMSTAVHRSPNKLWRSNSIFVLRLTYGKIPISGDGFYLQEQKSFCCRGTFPQQKNNHLKQGIEAAIRLWETVDQRRESKRSEENRREPKRTEDNRRELKIIEENPR